jgi:formylmethanofuran dehydrogenase subunit E
MLDPIKLTPESAARISCPWRCRMCGEKFTQAAHGNPNICLKCGNDDGETEQQPKTNET